MSDAFQRFAASRPADTNEADLYASTTGSLIGVVHVCNQHTAALTYRVAVTDAGTGVAADGADFLEYDTTIQPNTSHKVTIEGTTGTTTIRIKASLADKISFVFMGVKIT